MLAVALLALIIFAWLSIRHSSASREELRAIAKAVQEINRRLAERDAAATAPATTEAEAVIPPAPAEPAPAPEELPAIPAAETPSAEATSAEIDTIPPAEPAPEPAPEELPAILAAETMPAESDTTVAVAAEVAPPPPPPREPTAFELRLLALRNWFIYGNAAGRQGGEDVEKMLATTWLLRSGILVILVTSVFLLKLSIDRGLLSPAGRVALSYLCGAAFLHFGLRRRMRQRYWSLGQALIGIGLGVFYFSSFAMTSMYHLVPPLVGGAVMALVTVTAGVLADRLAALPVAMVSMLGGFATPLLLNTGAKNFPGLGCYLLLLGAGVLWLANRRDWQQLTWLAMLFTYGIFGMACQAHFATADYACCQWMMVLFFILYSTSVFIHNIRLNLAAGALEIIGLLGNSLLFFWISSYLTLKVSNGDRLALAPLTIALAAYYLGHAVFLQRRQVAAHRNLLLIFCALCGFYLSLTAPVVLTGHWLGTAWALQALTMLWLGYQLESRFIRGCAWVLYALTLLRLCGWDYAAYHRLDAGDGFWLAALARCLQFAIPVACLALGARLARRAALASPAGGDAAPAATPAPANPVAGILLSCAFLAGFIFLRLEMAADLGHSLPSLQPAGNNLVWLGAALLALALLRRGWSGCWWLFVTVLAVAVLLGAAFDFCWPSNWNCCRPDFMWSYWLGTLVNTLVLVLGIWLLRRKLPQEQGGWSRSIGAVCDVAWPVLLFLHTTRELKTIITYRLPGLSGGGVSVLWSLFAFALVFTGLRRSSRLRRCLGLVGFAIIVLKVFLVDMQRLDAYFRVGAFLVFGGLLMGAAFVYLKFWHGKENP